MTTLREASQQALDNINELFAAEQSDGGERGGHIRTPATREHLVRVARARKALHESCDNLRAALAQQDEPLNLADPAVRKRLATQWGYVPAALAEPVQEPVAWIESPHGAIRANPNYKFTFPSQLLQWQIPLYTAPPQRKPLTLEEIHHATGHCGVSKYTAITITRAVERVHGIT